jgi:uncharacterized protein with PIN domain
VIFWDSSAIIPLCVTEPSSATVKSILAGDPSAVVWWTTRTECISALARQIREGGITLAGERQARDVLHKFASTWIEIQPTNSLGPRRRKAAWRPRAESGGRVSVGCGAAMVSRRNQRNVSSMF